ncbi:MAG: shikimate dehydrogenase [Thiomargarita sp.]|nr:shikimate dehydrogenase [Thiomargarita sp.]
MNQTKKTIDSYAVMGNPISHSQSPLIHHSFAEQVGQQIEYNAILVDKQAVEFKIAVKKFQTAGGKGLNITIPFKQDAWELANQHGEVAKRAGAVNTLWFDELGNIHGENTDGVGLVNDLVHNHGFAIKEKRLLILGAGGAVRGILEPLLNAQPSQCIIANRTISKAIDLVKLFDKFGDIASSSYEALQGQSFDLIINGTSTSLQGQLPPLVSGLLNKDGVCYDMMYANIDTLFMQWGKQQGSVCTLDGLGMLVEQAAESFYLWRGIRPKTKPVIERVRDYLATN